MGISSSIFKRKGNNHPQLGLMVSDEGIFAAYLKPGTSEPIGTQIAAGQWYALSSWVEQQNLAGTTVHMVLSWENYQLFQVEAPNVPADEINPALLFSLRDRLNFPIAEGQIDSFPVPQEASRSNQNRVNVVAAHLPTLTRFIDGIRSARLEPAIIDIPELAFSNMLANHEDMSKGICFVAYREDRVTLMIYRNCELFVTRTLSSIQNWQQCLQPDTHQAAENLVLEIQRTLDYYQSQLGQPPVSKVLLPNWSEPLQPLLAFLQSTLGIGVELFELPQVSESIPVPQQQSIALAIAGAHDAKH